MRLTVGPHPAAVYWRRRGVVLVALAMVVLVISYACSGAENSNAGEGAKASTSPTPSRTPTPSSTLLRPTTPTATPTQPAFTLPPGGQTGPCTDGELEVVSKTAVAEVQRGNAVEFTIRIKNISKRTCSRDIGADMQELRLLDGTGVIWSSDDCGANKGHDVRSFTPSREVSFTLRWPGRRSRSGTGAKLCGGSAPIPGPAVYQLVARLDQKVSAPVDLRIQS